MLSTFTALKKRSDKYEEHEESYYRRRTESVARAKSFG
jgi:hypothetical protein